MLRDLYLLVADLLLEVIHPLDQGLGHHGNHAHLFFILTDLRERVGELGFRFPVVAHLPDGEQLGVRLLVFLFDLAQDELLEVLHVDVGVLRIYVKDHCFYLCSIAYLQKSSCTKCLNG